jgi:hypothetical protein
VSCCQVEVVGVNESLKKIAYDALTTRPNFAYTLKEVEADLKRVFATGEAAARTATALLLPQPQPHDSRHTVRQTQMQVALQVHAQ